MIEKIVFDYLKAHMDVPVALMAKECDRYVLIERAGSSRQDRIEKATIIIQSYGKSLYEAAALNEKVKLQMEDIDKLSEIGSCNLQTDYNFTDKTTKKYRYQALYEISKL